MNIVLADLGERLQLLRKSLDISQKDLAVTLKVGQNQISRIENGLGGSIDLLLQLFNYYSDFFHISYLFSEQFQVVRKEEVPPGGNPLHDIALEKMKLMKTDIDDQLTSIISLMERI